MPPPPGAPCEKPKPPEKTEPTATSNGPYDAGGSPESKPCEKKKETTGGADSHGPYDPGDAPSSDPCERRREGSSPPPTIEEGDAPIVEAPAKTVLVLEDGKALSIASLEPPVDRAVDLVDGRTGAPHEVTISASDPRWKSGELWLLPMIPVAEGSVFALAPDPSPDAYVQAHATIRRLGPLSGVYVLTMLIHPRAAALTVTIVGPGISKVIPSALVRPGVGALEVELDAAGPGVVLVVATFRPPGARAGGATVVTAALFDDVTQGAMAGVVPAVAPPAAAGVAPVVAPPVVVPAQVSAPSFSAALAGVHDLLFSRPVVAGPPPPSVAGLSMAEDAETLITLATLPPGTSTVTLPGTATFGDLQTAWQTSSFGSSPFTITWDGATATLASASSEPDFSSYFFSPAFFPATDPIGPYFNTPGSYTQYWAVDDLKGIYAPT
jgi:hypothetical protein